MEAVRFLKRQARRHPRLVRVLQRPSVRITLAARRVRRALFLRGLLVPDDDLAGWIARRIQDASPTMIGKLGTLEFELVRYDDRRTFTGRRRSVPRELRRLAFTNVGLFPDSDEGMWTALDAIRRALASLDATAVYGHPGEAPLLRRHCPALQVGAGGAALEPWHNRTPWTHTLAGKRVLVVHPFVDTIATQYAERREAVWAAIPGLLPEFELRTVRMPLSPALVPPQDASWTARLDRIQAEMEAQPFDVALIGAGGMSLPLAAHAKRLGAIGVHLGGGTQLAFGIRGRRWDDAPDVRALMNDAWVRPSPRETPEEATHVENACYW